MNEKQNFRKVIVGFKNNLKSEPSHPFCFSWSGKEFIGNHTDHQRREELFLLQLTLIFLLRLVLKRMINKFKFLVHNYRKPINVD